MQTDTATVPLLPQHSTTPQRLRLRLRLCVRVYSTLPFLPETNTKKTGVCDWNKRRLYPKLQYFSHSLTKPAAGPKPNGEKWREFRFLSRRVCLFDQKIWLRRNGRTAERLKERCARESARWMDGIGWSTGIHWRGPPRQQPQQPISAGGGGKQMLNKLFNK